MKTARLALGEPSTLARPRLRLKGKVRLADRFRKSIQRLWLRPMTEGLALATPSCPLVGGNTAAPLKVLSTRACRSA